MFKKLLFKLTVSLVPLSMVTVPAINSSVLAYKHYNEIQIQKALRSDNEDNFDPVFPYTYEMFMVDYGKKRDAYVASIAPADFDNPGPGVIKRWYATDVAFRKFDEMTRNSEDRKKQIFDAFNEIASFDSTADWDKLIDDAIEASLLKNVYLSVSGNSFDEIKTNAEKIVEDGDHFNKFIDAIKLPVDAKSLHEKIVEHLEIKIKQLAEDFEVDYLSPNTNDAAGLKDLLKFLTVTEKQSIYALAEQIYPDQPWHKYEKVEEAFDKAFEDAWQTIDDKSQFWYDTEKEYRLKKAEAYKALLDINGEKEGVTTTTRKFNANSLEEYKKYVTITGPADNEVWTPNNIDLYNPEHMKDFNRLVPGIEDLIQELETPVLSGTPDKVKLEVTGFQFRKDDTQPEYDFTDLTFAIKHPPYTQKDTTEIVRSIKTYAIISDNDNIVELLNSTFRDIVKISEDDIYAKFFQKRDQTLDDLSGGYYYYKGSYNSDASIKLFDEFFPGLSTEIMKCDKNPDGQFPALDWKFEYDPKLAFTNRLKIDVVVRTMEIVEDASGNPTTEEKISNDDEVGHNPSFPDEWIFEVKNETRVFNEFKEKILKDDKLKIGATENGALLQKYQFDESFEGDDDHADNVLKALFGSSWNSMKTDVEAFAQRRIDNTKVNGTSWDPVINAHTKTNLYEYDFYFKDETQWDDLETINNENGIYFVNAIIKFTDKSYSHVANADKNLYEFEYEFKVPINNILLKYKRNMTDWKNRMSARINPENIEEFNEGRIIDEKTMGEIFDQPSIYGFKDTNVQAGLDRLSITWSPIFIKPETPEIRWTTFQITNEQDPRSGNLREHILVEVPLNTAEFVTAEDINEAKQWALRLKVGWDGRDGTGAIIGQPILGYDQAILSIPYFRSDPNDTAPHPYAQQFLAINAMIYNKFIEDIEQPYLTKARLGMMFDANGLYEVGTLKREYQDAMEENLLKALEAQKLSIIEELEKIFGEGNVPKEVLDWIEEEYIEVVEAVKPIKGNVDISLSPEEIKAIDDLLKDFSLASILEALSKVDSVSKIVLIVVASITSVAALFAISITQMSFRLNNKMKKAGASITSSKHKTWFILSIAIITTIISIAIFVFVFVIQGGL